MANESISHPGGWDAVDLVQNNVVFSVSVVAAILHCLLWCQMFLQKVKFDLTILYALGYIVTDIFLLSFYFIQYSIRIRSWIPVTRISCYFEAYSMFYINLLEVYCLTALNTSRYWRIVRNQNVYTIHRRMIITSVVVVPLLILVNLITQDISGWCVVLENIGSSCILTYTNIPVRIWNMTVMLMIPILISFSMLFGAFRYLQRANAQQILVRRNHHRRLVVDSLIFYSFWVSFWLPLMIVTVLDINNLNGSIPFVAAVLNTFETLSDAVISIFLDKRFARVWKRSYQWISHRFGYHANARVTPALEIVGDHQVHIPTWIPK